MSRRGFLLLALSALGVGEGSRRRGLRSYTEDMDAAFRSRESARFIGEAYLQRHPDERDRDRLLRDLDLRWTSGRQSVRVVLAERQRADFAAGRVVRLDGWVLSETEAKVCALAAV